MDHLPGKSHQKKSQHAPIRPSGANGQRTDTTGGNEWKKKGKIGGKFHGRSWVADGALSVNRHTRPGGGKGITYPQRRRCPPVGRGGRPNQASKRLPWASNFRFAPSCLSVSAWWIRFSQAKKKQQNYDNKTLDARSQTRGRPSCSANPVRCKRHRRGLHRKKNGNQTKTTRKPGTNSLQISFQIRQMKKTTRGKGKSEKLPPNAIFRNSLILQNSIPVKRKK